MDDWQQDWMRSVETFANSVGQFFQDVGKDVSDAADALIELTEEMAENLEQFISPNLDRVDNQFDEWLDPILQTILGIENTIDQAVEPVTHTVEPWLNQHPICVGCRNYHGQTYNGTMLICAMHPYGVAEDWDSCPDKEPIVWSLPSSMQPWRSEQDEEDHW